MLNAALIYSSVVCVGMAIGMRFGILDGFAAAGALYTLMPYRYTK